MRLLFCLILSFLSAAQCFGQPKTIRVAGWNVEGNGNDIDPALIERQLGQKNGIDIWGLSEVRPQMFDAMVRGAAIGENARFDIVRGSTGNNIRLAIVFDTSKVDLLSSEELRNRVFNRHRAPLVAKFRGRSTGTEFLFMVNHLASGSASANLAQAQFLNNWATRQSLPVVMVGDLNFRVSVPTGLGRPGYDVLRFGNWFELAPIFITRTGANFNSVLDHVFIANRHLAPGWSGEARILNRSGDSPSTTSNFSDGPRESDHLPVDATLTLRGNGGTGDGGTGDGGTGATGPRITALVPNPRGSDRNRESVTIGNTTGSDISLSDWVLQDDDGGEFDLTGTIAANSRKKFTLDTTLLLGNSGDTLTLVDPSGRVVQTVTYSSATSGQVIRP